MQANAKKLFFYLNLLFFPLWHHQTKASVRPKKKYPLRKNQPVFCDLKNNPIYKNGHPVYEHRPSSSLGKELEKERQKTIPKILPSLLPQKATSFTLSVTPKR